MNTETLPSHIVESPNTGLFCTLCGSPNCVCITARREPAEPRTSTTIFIPEFRFSSLSEAVAKLNKRAAKLHVEPIVLRATGAKELRDFSTIIHDPESGRDNTREEKVEAIEIEISGVSPKLDGWQFAASIDPVAEGVNVLNKSPLFTLEIPKRFRACTQDCDHCKATRNRKNTYVLHNTDSGDWKQVGTSCLKDFLGHKDIHAITDSAAIFLAFAHLVEEYSEFEGSCGRREITTDLKRLLIATYNIVAEYGFTSNGAVRNDLTGRLCATADRVTNVIFPSNNTAARDFAEKFSAETPENIAAAEACIEWVHTIALDIDNDYLANLAAVFVQDYVTGKRFGLAVSALTAHRRHLEQIVARERQAEKLNEFVGTVGERVVLNGLTVVRQIELENDFGKSTLVLLEDAQGRAFKWFSSSCPFSQSDTGKTFDIKATIKGHDEFKGRKQTSLSRAKIVDPNAKKPAKFNKAGYKIEGITPSVDGAICHVYAEHKPGTSLEAGSELEIEGVKHTILSATYAGVAARGNRSYVYQIAKP